MESVVRLQAPCTIGRLPDKAALARYIDVEPMYDEALTVTCAERLRHVAGELLASVEGRVCSLVMSVMHGVACGASLVEIATPDLDVVMALSG
jgi:hypothetical protein